MPRPSLPWKTCSWSARTTEASSTSGIPHLTGLETSTDTRGKKWCRKNVLNKADDRANKVKPPVSKVNRSNKKNLWRVEKEKSQRGNRKKPFKIKEICLYSEYQESLLWIFWDECSRTSNPVMLPHHTILKPVFKRPLRLLNCIKVLEKLH